MVNKRFLLILISCAAGLLLTSKSAFAAIRCETQYGGGETCVKTGELQIDKEVFDPERGIFVDNLAGLNAYVFLPGQEVTFKLKIKNVGDETLTNIKVQDILPQYLSLSNGSINTFTIDSLQAGESVERFVKATVASEKELESGIVCKTNYAEAKNDSEFDSDNSKICMSKRVLGITTLPKTGSNLLIFASIFTAFTSLIGLVLAKSKIS